MRRAFFLASHLSTPAFSACSRVTSRGVVGSFPFFSAHSLRNALLKCTAQRRERTEKNRGRRDFFIGAKHLTRASGQQK